MVPKEESGEQVKIPLHLPPGDGGGAGPGGGPGVGPGGEGAGEGPGGPLQAVFDAQIALFELSRKTTLQSLCITSSTPPVVFADHET